MVLRTWRMTYNFRSKASSVGSQRSRSCPSPWPTNSCRTERLTQSGYVAQRDIMRRDGTPPQNALPFFDNDLFQQAPKRRQRWLGSRGRKTMPTRNREWKGQLDPGNQADGAERAASGSRTRGAVARVGLATACAAMPQVHQRVQRVAQDLDLTAAVDVGDKPDTAGSVLPAWIIKGVIEQMWIGHVHERVLSLPGAGVPPVVRHRTKKVGHPERL